MDLGFDANLIFSSRVPNRVQSVSVAVGHVKAILWRSDIKHMPLGYHGTIAQLHLNNLRHPNSLVPWKSDVA